MEAEAGAAGTRAPEGKDADGPAREEAPEGKAAGASEGGDDGGKGGGGEGCGGDGSREHGNTKAARSTGKGSKAGKKAGGKLREKGGASEGCVDGQERHDWQRWHKFTPGKKVTPAHAAPCVVRKSLSAGSPSSVWSQTCSPGHSAPSLTPPLCSFRCAYALPRTGSCQVSVRAGRVRLLQKVLAEVRRYRLQRMPRDRAQEMVTRARSPFDLADLLTGQIELLLQLKESMDHGASPPAALLGRMINDHAQVKAHTHSPRIWKRVQ